MTKIRINSLSIKNYRSFKERQTFIFPEDCSKPISIIGYNNAGKSNLMACIRYGLYEHVSDTTFTIEDFHNCKRENQPNISLEYTKSFENGDKKYKNNLSASAEEDIIKIPLQETIDLASPKKDAPNLKGAVRRDGLVFYINFHDIKNEINTKKGSWGRLRSFLGKHIHKILEEDKVMKSHEEEFNEALGRATSKLRKGSKLDGFIKKIEECYINNLQDDHCEIAFESPSYRELFLGMIFKVGLNSFDGGRENREMLPITNFGDGYISMFIMAVIQAIAETTLDRNTGEAHQCIFLFEEPESFLHENHQEFFYKKVICGLSQKGHQVIYTTHSHKMLDAFDTEGIIRLELDKDKGQTVKTYPIKQAVFHPQMPLDDGGKEVLSYANFNSFIKAVEPNLNKMLFSQKVLLVEGPNDLLVYKHFIRKEAEVKENDASKAETYLSFNNIAILVHHGKATAHILLDLCKHFNIQYFAINDWDLDELFLNELASIDKEENLRKHQVYLGDESITSSDDKRHIMTNWKLINSAGVNNIHFNFPRLEDVIGYDKKDKRSLGILNCIQKLEQTPEKLFSFDLRTFLGLEQG